MTKLPSLTGEQFVKALSEYTIGYKLSSRLLHLLLNFIHVCDL